MRLKVCESMSVEIWARNNLHQKGWATLAFAWEVKPGQKSPEFPLYCFESLNAVSTFQKLVFQFQTAIEKWGEQK